MSEKSNILCLKNHLFIYLFSYLFETGSHYVVQAGLELSILLTQPLKLQALQVLHHHAQLKTFIYLFIYLFLKIYLLQFGITIRTNSLSMELGN
jgi:hypothetical protein